MNIRKLIRIERKLHKLLNIFTIISLFITASYFVCIGVSPIEKDFTWLAKICLSIIIVTGIIALPDIILFNIIKGKEDDMW
jgi:hypothetical protein